jgi:hypothetical protein
VKRPRAFIGCKSGRDGAWIAIGGPYDGEWMTPAEALKLSGQLAELAALDSPEWRVAQLARQKAAMLRRQRRK